MVPITTFGQGDKSSLLDAFFSFEGLRPNNTERIYEMDFLKDSTYIYNLNSDSAWVLSEREVFSYDNQGNRISGRISQKVNETWNPIESRQFYYDHDGRLQKRVNSIWSQEEKSYRLDSRNHFYYNFIGNVSEQLTEIRIDNDWQLSEKIEIAYNSIYLKSSEVSSLWSEEDLEWKPDYRIIYSYNDIKEISSETYQVWVDSLNSWVNKYSEEFYYGPENRLIEATKHTWNPVLQEWEGHIVVALSYNERGQLESTEQYSVEEEQTHSVRNTDAEYDANGNLDLIVYQEWSIEDQAWVPYQRHDHFWAEYLTGNLHEKPDEIQCIYANPYMPGLPWYCKGLLSGEEYTLTVYDLQGRVRHHQVIKGGDTFRPGGFLENGMYIVSIRGGLTAHQEKVLVRK